MELSSKGPKKLKYLGCNTSESISFGVFETTPTADTYGMFNIGDLNLKQDYLNPIFLYMFTEYVGYQVKETYHAAYTDGAGVYHPAWYEKVLTGTATWTEIYPQELDPENFPTDDGDAIASADGVLKLYGKEYNFTTYGLNDLITIKLSDNVTIPTSLTVGGLTEGFVRADAGLLSAYVDGGDGETLIASDSGIPLWKKIEEGDASFTINYGANSVELTCVVPIVFGQINADVGNAVPDGAGIIYIAGGLQLHTTALDNVITALLDNDVTTVGSFTSHGIIVDTGFTVGNDLTVTDINAHGVPATVYTQSDGTFSTMQGDDGEVLIGGAMPQWGLLTSSDGSVVRTFGPNILDLKVVAPGSFTSIETDSGTATSAASQIFVDGAALQTNTTASGDTLNINLEPDVFIDNSLTVSTLQGTLYANNLGLFSGSQGADLQFFSGVSSSIPEWLTPVSEDGTMSIDYGSVAGTLNFKSLFIGPIIPPDLWTISGDTGTATPVLGEIKIKGGDNIHTYGSGKTIFVHLNKSIDQPTTNFDLSEGAYNLGGLPFLHNWAWRQDDPSTIHQGDKCTYVGLEAGSHGSTINPNNPITPTLNTAIGYKAMSWFTASYPAYDWTKQGYNNTAFGYVSLRTNSGGYSHPKNNICLGAYSNTYASDSSILIRTGSIKYVALNSVQIGSQRSCTGILGNGQQDDCYIAGIHNGGLLDTTVMKPVFVDQYAQLGVNYIAPYYDIEDGNLLIGSYSTPCTHGMYNISHPFYGPNRGKIISSDDSISVVRGPGTLDLKVGSIPCFSAYQATTINNVTGDGTTYSLGTQQALVEIFDDNSNFYPGDGAGNYAYFETPFDGTYQFTMSIVADNLNVITAVLDVSIYSYNVSRPGASHVGFINPVTDFVGEQGIFCSGPMLLYAGEKVKFNIRMDICSYGKTIGVQGPDTQVSGFLIQRT